MLKYAVETGSHLCCQNTDISPSSAFVSVCVNCDTVNLILIVSVHSEANKCLWNVKFQYMDFNIVGWFESENFGCGIILLKVIREKRKRFLCTCVLAFSILKFHSLEILFVFDTVHNIVVFFFCNLGWLHWWKKFRYANTHSFSVITYTNRYPNYIVVFRYFENIATIEVHTIRWRIAKC